MKIENRLSVTNCDTPRKARFYIQAWPYDSYCFYFMPSIGTAYARKGCLYKTLFCSITKGAKVNDKI